MRPTLIAARMSGKRPWRRRLARVVPFLVAVATAMTLAGASDATFPGANGTIVFSSNRDGNFEIYTMKADGTSVTRLTNSPEPDWFPAWSPDGERIAWLSSQPFSGQNLDEVFVMSSTGGGKTNLTKFSLPGSTPLFGGAPGWTPKGDKIGFFRPFAFIGGEFYTINPNGSGLRRVRADDGTSVSSSQPRWSPSGDKILFGGRKADVFGAFTINPDGSGLTNLTSGLDLKPYSPDWSPDGKRVVFSSFTSGAGVGQAGREIHSMSADGTGLTRLTNNRAYDGSPRWSPDGTKIAFTSDRDGNQEIYVMNANGSNQTRLTNSPAADFSPDWQPLNLPPSVSSLTVAPTSFQAGRNAVVQFAVSERGVASIAVQRPTIGRKVTIGTGRKQRTVCRRNTTRVAPSLKTRCTLWLAASTSDQIADESVFEGLNNVLFNGKIGGKALAPGQYRIQIQVADGLGKRGNAAVAGFRIVGG